MIRAITPRQAIAGAIALIALIIALAGGDERPAAEILALVLFTIGLWATGAIPEHLTALVFFAIATVFALAPPAVVFAGFESAAFWLIFGGMVLGVSVHQTGLGARLAGRLAALFGTSYAGVVFGTLTTGVVLGFLMPSSMGRTVLLLPIALLLAERYGFREGSKGHHGIVLAAGLGCFLPTFAILPANVPNVVLLGIGEELFGVVPTYGRWLLLHFPVLGLLKTLVIGALILVFFPDRPNRRDVQAETRPLSQGEWRLAVILALALLGWMTDFAHQISPAWIALGAGVVSMWPGLGLFGVRDFAKIDFSPLFYVAGILGLGAMIAHSGWAAELGALIPRLVAFEPGQTLATFATVVGSGIAVSLGVTLPGVPAVLTPLAGDLSAATGLTVETILMLQVPSFSTPIFAYQAPPLIVAMHLGRMRPIAGAKLIFAIAAATILVLLPLDYLWLRTIGVL